VSIPRPMSRLCIRSIGFLSTAVTKLCAGFLVLYYYNIL
jgi:hypothetical protein